MSCYCLKYFFCVPTPFNSPVKFASRYSEVQARFCQITLKIIKFNDSIGSFVVILLFVRCPSAIRWFVVA